MRWYLDTSAAWKLMAAEAESEVLASRIDDDGPELASCLLLDTELRRASQRSTTVSQQMVSDFLDTVDLYEVSASMFREAGRLPGRSLRSLDALHLAAALHLDVDRIVTYDARMASAAQSLGLTVLAPS